MLAELIAGVGSDVISKHVPGIAVENSTKEEPLTISLSLVPYWNIWMWILVIVAICVAPQTEKNLSLPLAYCEQKTLQTFGVSLHWQVIRVLPSL